MALQQVALGCCACFFECSVGCGISIGGQSVWLAVCERYAGFDTFCSDRWWQQVCSSEAIWWFHYFCARGCYQDLQAGTCCWLSLSTLGPLYELIGGCPVLLHSHMLMAQIANGVWRKAGQQAIDMKK